MLRLLSRRYAWREISAVAMASCPANQHKHYADVLIGELPMGASSNDADRHIMIRLATPDDISKVRNLLIATWHDTYDSLLGVERVTETTNEWHALDVLATQAARPNTSFLVASQDGEVVGHTFVVEQDGGVLLLSRLYVLPNRQRQGIGEGLLRAAVRRHAGTKRVQLVVEARNTKALAFYGRHGFVVTGEVEDEEPRPLRMEMAINK